MTNNSDKSDNSDKEYDPLSDEQYQRNEGIFSEFLKNTAKPRRQKKSSDRPKNTEEI